MKKILIVISILFLCLTGFTYAENKTSQKNTDKVAAKVNGKPIYESEIKNILNQFLQRSGMDPKSIDYNSPQLANYKKNILDRLIERELLLSEASKTIKKDFTKEVNDEYNKVAKQFKSAEELEKKLKEAGTNSKEIKEKIKKNLIIQEYVKELGKKNKVTEKEIKEFYDKHKDAFKQEEQVHAAHILIQTKNTTDEEAKKKINAIYDELKKGADFEKLAKEKSEGPSKAHGGDLGYFKRHGQMVEEFSKVAFETPVGQFSKPFKTQFGYHILKVLDKKPAKTISYEESKDKIEKILKNKKLKEILDAKLKALKEKSKIERFQ